LTLLKVHRAEKQVLYAAPFIAARSSVYRLLASLFARELTAEHIVGFQRGNGSQLLDALESVAAYAAFAGYLKTQFANLANPQQAALDLAESYAWIFHGVGGPHAAPPYASVYLSKSGSTHQEVEQELYRIIGEQGLCSENIGNEPYDHLSVILEFAAWLDEQEEHLPRQEFRKEIIEK
jgi:TorA-specific chaperone